MTEPSSNHPVMTESTPPRPERPVDSPTASPMTNPIVEQAISPTYSPSHAAQRFAEDQEDVLKWPEEDQEEATRARRQSTDHSARCLVRLLEARNDALMMPVVHADLKKFMALKPLP